MPASRPESPEIFRKLPVVVLTVSRVVLQAGLPDLPTDVDRYLDALGDVAVFLAVFVALYLLGRRVVEPAVRRALDRSRIHRTAANTALKIVHVVVIVVALRLALDVADYGYLLSLPPTFAAALTVALGFASRDIASNLVSGAFIVTDPKFNIGDWIRWRDREGVIEDISFRVTRVRTFDNELVTVPNSELATNAVTNLVAKRRLRVRHSFHVADDADLGRVGTILLTAVEEDDRILDEPTPTVEVTALDEGRATVEARYWVADPTHRQVVRIRSAFLRRVTERFDAEGIDLPPSW